MPAHQNKNIEEPRRRSEKKKEKTVLKNVVSLRVSDQELQVLEKITRSSAKTVSDIVREAIEFWLSRRQRLCRE